MKAAPDRYAGLTREELLAELRRRDENAGYGLVWEGDALPPPAAHEVVLELDAELSVGEAPYAHLLIEGDNLDALQVLRRTHRGRVKCIYLDPPYNTGGREFGYNDRYDAPATRFRHSAWLEFMARRLRGVQGLLTDDGVLLISIDDHALAPLRLLLDELWPGSYVATFVWRRRSGKNDVPAHFVSVDHEYVLCFAQPGFSFAGSRKALEDYRQFDPGNPDPWKRGDLTKPHHHRARPNAFYPLQDPATGLWYPPNPKRVWAFASQERSQGQKLRRETMEDLIGAGRVLFPEADRSVTYGSVAELRAAIGAGTAPRFLTLGLFDTPQEEEAYLSFYVGKPLGYGTPGYKRFRSEVKTASKPVSTWLAGLRDPDPDPEVTTLRSGLNADGTALLGQMLQDSKLEFAFPKPLSLLTALLEQATSPGDLILDFFAGSGTTGHAVLALNAGAEPGAQRRFILVSSSEATAQQPQRNLCRDVTRERLRAAVQGYRYRTRSGQAEVGGLGSSVAYLRARPRQATELRAPAERWLTAQLALGAALCPWEPQRTLQRCEDEESCLLYLPQLTAVAPDAEVADAAVALDELRAEVTQARARGLTVRVLTDEPQAVRAALGDVPVDGPVVGPDAEPCR